MSPSYYHTNILTVFTDDLAYSNPCKDISQPTSRFSIRRESFTNEPLIKRETKKEKTKRIAKEKMFASWKVYNQKTESVIEIKQICKPRHKIYKK